jgi:hypothetical protein
MLVELLAKRLARRISDTKNHQIQCHLRSTDGAHAVMNASRSVVYVSVYYNIQTRMYSPKSALNNFESTTPAEHEVGQRYADVVVDYFTVSFRRIVITKDFHWPNDLHSRCIRRNNDHALLLVLVLVVGVTLAHNQVYLAARVARSTDPPANQSEHVVT